MSFIVEPPFSGGTLTGPLTLPAGSAAAPSLLFTGAGTTTGLFATGPTGLSIASSGVSVVTFNNSTTRFRDSTSSDAILLEANTAFIGLGTANDVRFGRDGAAILALRNGTNAQTFKVYGTTDAGLTNYERLAISAQQGVGFTIRAETLGTGADNLDITIAPAGTGRVRFPDGSAGALSLTFTSSSTTGLYMGGSGTRLGISAAGTVVTYFGAALVTVASNANIGWSASGGADAAAQDTSFARNAAGIAEVNNGTIGTYRDLKTRNLITNPGKFAALVAAATAGKGARAFINDGAGAVFGVAAAGGGALNVPVYSDGTNWIVG